MSTENENLFEGLEIMSPEELNSAVANKEESENEIIIKQSNEILLPLIKDNFDKLKNNIYIN